VSVCVFWLVSLGVFPRPSVAAQLRRKPDAHWVMVVGGVGMGAFALLRGGEVGLEHAVTGSLLGVTLALAGAGNLLYAKTLDGASVSLRRFLLGVGTFVAGAVWLWLVIRPTL
ncbi:MAG: hypothetical protein ABW217_23515, partial [Polyangiaceae bacterium]